MYGANMFSRQGSPPPQKKIKNQTAGSQKVSSFKMAEFVGKKIGTMAK